MARIPTVRIAPDTWWAIYRDGVRVATAPAAAVDLAITTMIADRFPNGGAPQGYRDTFTARLIDTPQH